MRVAVYEGDRALPGAGRPESDVRAAQRARRMDLTLDRAAGVIAAHRSRSRSTASVYDGLLVGVMQDGKPVRPARRNLA